VSELGPITQYGDLRRAVSLRARELGLRHLEVDDLAGLQQGYTSKLICGTRHFGSMSMGAILGALKAELVLRPRTEDEPRQPEGEAS
jgi:hypothetical protein